MLRVVCIRVPSQAGTRERRLGPAERNTHRTQERMPPEDRNKPVKRHRTLQSNKKEARGWATFAPTGMQSGAYRTKGGKRSKYSRSVKYQVELVKYQVKLGQGQK